MPNYLLKGFGSKGNNDVLLDPYWVQFFAESDMEAIEQAKRTAAVDKKIRYGPKLFRVEKVEVDFKQTKT